MLTAEPEGGNDGEASPTGLQQKGWERLKNNNRTFERDYLIFQRFCLDNGVHLTALDKINTV
jgi:hypothetical protein